MNNQVVTISSAWHFRLGLLFDQKLGILCKDQAYISHSNNNTCTICPLAKQKRLPFSTSNSKSGCAFAHIHIDVWGRFQHPQSIGTIIFSLWWMISRDMFGFF